MIRFADPRGFDFPYLLSMLHDSFMSRANTLVVPGGEDGAGDAAHLHADLRDAPDRAAHRSAPAEPLWMLRTSDRRPPLRTQRVMSFLATLPAAFSGKAG